MTEPSTAGVRLLMPVKVVVVCLKDDYNQPARGLSLEYYNLYLAMKNVASEVILFDFGTLYRERGQDEMNRALVELLERERPDVTLVALFSDELTPAAIQKARQYTKTVAYFWDDIWRVDYVAKWAPNFDYFTTPIWGMYRRYQAAGLTGAVYSPFGYNSSLSRATDAPMRHDVSFVGGSHPWRVFVVDRLRKAGFDVTVRGPFWPGGRLSPEEMGDLFQTSKINLNLSNARQWDARYLFSSWRAVRNTLRTPKVRDGVKVRHFEIPGAGGFQLSYYAEGLERYFEIGDEIAIYLDLDELVEKVEYYLTHEAERERIARAGHARSLGYTMEARLSDLLSEVLRR